MLRARGYSEEFIARAQGYLKNPGISVVAPALLAAETAEVHAMHDPTEGGVMTGLLEMARAAGSGMTVDLDAIPVPQESAGSAGSSGWIRWGRSRRARSWWRWRRLTPVRLAEMLSAAGYPTARIGQMTRPARELVATRAGERVPWPIFRSRRDHKLFSPSSFTPARARNNLKECSPSSAISAGQIRKKKMMVRMPRTVKSAAISSRTIEKSGLASAPSTAVRSAPSARRLLHAHQDRIRVELNAQPEQQQIAPDERQPLHETVGAG